MSIRTVFALEQRELDQEAAPPESEDEPEPVTCPFCPPDNPTLLLDEDDLKIHILRFHTGQPSTEGKTLAKLVKNGRV